MLKVGPGEGRDVKNCTESVKFFKALGLPPLPPKEDMSDLRMSLLNLGFNMTIYEVLLQI